MASRKIVPRADNEGGIGTALKQWASGWIKALTVTTINALTLAAAAVGFTLAGGTTSKTLTVDETGAMSDKAPKASPTFTTKITTPIIDLTSGQIGFPATQVPSSDPNTLDDYEEGTCTMGISFGGGTAGITYFVNTGYYTKTGNIVTIIGYLGLTSKGSSTGAALLTGLPFTVASLVYAAVALCFNVITYANQYQGYVIANSNTIFLGEVTEAGIQTALTNADFANNSSIIIGVSYRV